MAALSSPGIGSGLDIGGIISKLMTVEQRPLVALGTHTVELQTQLSAYGSLKGAVSTFRDAVTQLSDLSKFKVYAATSSDKTIVDATASSTAARGTYNLLVNRIAENHRMAANTTFANIDTTTIGTAGDNMTITVGTTAFKVGIGGKNLAAVRDAINQAKDNAGVTASILKDNAGYHLSLSANKTGSANALSVVYSGTDPFAFSTLNADRDASGGFTPADLDASVKLEGKFNITSSSNSLTDTIGGVTLTLKAAGTVTINVDRDTAAVSTSVSNLAKAYSDLIGTMTKMRGDVLKSDSPVLLNLETQLRAVLNNPSSAASSFANVFELGISTQKNGALAVDAKVLTSAITSDFDGVANLFADPSRGIAKHLRDLADSFLATGGPLDGRTQGLGTALKQAADKKAQLQVRLQQIQARYTKQFNAMDALVASLNRSGSLLQQQLGVISSATTNALNSSNRIV
ncbi:MAG: flagellar filament capping protein FliD [Gammaproteobacteria bacterium]|nr:flagellar filament capping protein FliD [Gammaproteobacteria bacterium]